jgi:hypothetical protein
MMDFQQKYDVLMMNETHTVEGIQFCYFKNTRERMEMANLKLGSVAKIVV